MSLDKYNNRAVKLWRVTKAKTELRRYEGSNLGFGNILIRIPSDNHYTIAP